MRRILLTSMLCFIVEYVQHSQLITLTERKSTASSSDPHLFSLPEQGRRSAIVSSSQNLPPSLNTIISVGLPPQDLISTPTTRECTHETRTDGVISELESQSSAPSTASPAAKHISAPLGEPIRAPAKTNTMNSSIGSMIDSTAYVSERSRGPSASHARTRGDEQSRHEVAAGTPTRASTSSDRVLQNLNLPSNGHSVVGSALTYEPTVRAVERMAVWNSPITASSDGGMLNPNPQPSASYLSVKDSPPASTLRNTLHRSSHQDSAPARQQSKPGTSQSTVPCSLYPGPSITRPNSELHNDSAARKRPRTARSDHPERFLYAGNTFSNLDNQAFHEAAQNNPYLSQLTANASRPVYKTPLEARNALKDAKKKPEVRSVDYDRQIKELTEMLADFRKKYEKCKAMTKKAKIEVAGNLWDRLANIVQCPPDIDNIAKIDKGNMNKYVEEMKAWDKAIEHQVIIRKRIVYKEAIEKLLVKLDHLRAEKDSDS